MANTGSTHDTSAKPKPQPAEPSASPQAPGVAPDYVTAQFPARGMFVGFIIFALVVSTLAMSALIWYRWSGVREPTTAVIVKGDGTLGGTLITVSGPGKVVTATLEPGNNYSVPILVDPGIYTVRAEHRGRVLMEKDVEVRRFFGVMFNLADLPPPLPAAQDTLPSAVPASGPSARAAAETL